MFWCDLDGKSFISKSSLKSHMLSHMTTIECKICKLVLKVRSFKRHMLNVHECERNIKCNQCDKNFKTEASLLQHKASHDKNFECKVCNKKFALVHQLKTHEILHYEDKRPFICDICNKGFRCRYHLSTHKESHYPNHQKNVKIIKCEKCSFATHRRKTLIEHVIAHERTGNKRMLSNENQLSCPICDKNFDHKQSYLNHLKTMHKDLVYQCDLCGAYLN